MSEPETERGADELFCWNKLDEVCGPACVAYEKDRTSVETSPCKLINIGNKLSARLQTLSEKMQGR